MSAEVTKQYNFRYTVPASRYIRLTDTCEVTGRITQLLMHFPDGCNGYVLVAFGLQGRTGIKWVCPSTRDSWIALNNASPLWDMEVDGVVEGDLLWVEIYNYDAANDHTVSCVVTIKGIEKS